MEATIRSVLAYANASGMPLTAFEVSQRADGVDLSETMAVLDELVVRGVVVECDGWFGPAGAERLFFERHLERLNINADKWRAMLAKAKWLQAVPFIRAIAASGSLAQGTTGRDSDWDMFVIVRHGRLYSARFFLLAVSWALGVLRTKHDAVAPDTFCFNHYVTDRGLEIRHRSLYVAHALFALVPVHDPDDYVSRLLRSNQWIKRHGLPWARKPNTGRAMTPSPVLSLVRRAGEIVFGWMVGDGVECVLRTWQQRRIAREPATYESGGRVVADEQEIEFHPRSAERRVLSEYNATLANMGLDIREQESGLQ